MRDSAAFVAGLAALAVNCRVELTDPQTELYRSMLDDLSDADFARAVAACLRTSRWFPTIAELREKVSPYESPQAAAGVDFDRVRKAGRYTPVGYRWSYRDVSEQVGPIAAEAYVAAGGSSAFEQEQGETALTFLRKRFTEAYVVAFEAQRSGRTIASAESLTRLPNASPVRDLVDATVRQLSLPASSR